MMKRTTLRFWVDMILFLSVSGLIFTGIIMVFFTDSGPGIPESSKYFLELHRHQWGGIHFYFSLGFTAMLVFHLILEWNWIIGKTRHLFKKAWVLIPVIGLAGVLVYIGWMLTPRGRDSYQNQGRKWWQKNQLAKKAISPAGKMGLESATNRFRIDSKRNEVRKSPMERNSAGIDISGQDSLLSIESKTGIAVIELINTLRLPKNISQTERLGRLKRIYAFSMNDVRNAINFLRKQAAGS